MDSNTDRLPTPYLEVDRDIFARNTCELLSYTASHRLEVRSHFKAHKSLSLAALHLELGIRKFAVARVFEVEVLDRIGAPLDIMVAYSAYGVERARRLARLATRHTIRIAVDSIEHLDQLEAELAAVGACMGILVSIDLGLKRTGLSEVDKIVALALRAKKSSNLTFDGLEIYLGHLFGKLDDIRSSETYVSINHFLETVKAALDDHGITIQVVSSGSTPTVFHTHLIPLVNEIRVGTLFFNDYSQSLYHQCALERVSAVVHATVVSTAVAGRAVIDAGSKALARQSLLLDGEPVFGFVRNLPDAKLIAVHEEHGILDVSGCSKVPELGAELQIVPVNIPLVFNAFNHFYLKGSERTEKLPIEARGEYV